MAERVNLTQLMQDQICFLCCVDKKFLKIVRKSFDPSLMPSDRSRILVDACFRFYDTTNGEAPCDHISQEVGDKVIDKHVQDREGFVEYLKRLTSMKPPNPDYVLARLHTFIRQREMENALIEAANLVERQDFNEVTEVLNKAMSGGVAKFEVGRRFFDDYTGMNTNRLQRPYMMRTLIEELDGIIGGLRRRDLVCVLGGAKGKKSWTGTHLGCAALLQGLKVVHITHENSLEETEARYDRWAGALKHRRLEHERVTFYYRGKDRTIHTTMVDRPCVKDIGARVKARKRLERYGGKLIIKKFPMGTCTFTDMVQYLDYLENYEGIRPDLLINDYPEIMDLEVNRGNELRHAINKIYIQHKGLADERNMCVLVFSQATRSAIRAKRLSMQDFAEDIRKVANVDMALAVCQTDQQVEVNQGTLFVLAARGEQMDRGCGIVMNLDIGKPFSQSFKVNVGSDAITVAGDDEGKPNKPGRRKGHQRKRTGRYFQRR